MIAALSRTRAALAVIDVQEKLCAAMPHDVVPVVVRNVQILIEAARRFALPIVVSEQYPKGLGPTIPAIEEALAGASNVHRFDKLEFSAAATPQFSALAPKLGRDQWIVCGIEAHVCVLQTARGLVERGYAAHVANDAVCSRTKTNWQVGLSLCEKAGAIVSSTEVAVFELLERAGSDDFKALSKAIK